MNTDGSGFDTVCELPSGATSGWPGAFGDLLLDGSTLYGTTSSDTVFKVNTDGSDFTTLCTVPRGGSSYGESLQGHLALVGSTLYGTSRYGGTGKGSLYRVNTDGTGYEVIHEFSGTDGEMPSFGLVLAGDMLYGTTRDGGSDNRGTIFKIGLDGSTFQVVYSFSDGPTDGKGPYSTLTVVGSTIYGMTRAGPTNDYFGTIFALTIPEPSTLVLLGISAVGLLAYAWRKRQSGAGA